MKAKSGFLTRRILQHACTVKQEERAGRGALIQQSDTKADARQQWSSCRLEGLPGAHKEGPECWKGKSVCQEMIPTMGCG